MPEYKPSPYPEGVDPDRAPLDPASEPSLDELMDSLRKKMDEPYTKDELEAQAENDRQDRISADDRRPQKIEEPAVVLDAMEIKIQSEARERRWAELDPGTHELFSETRALFAQIGKTILKKHGDELLVSLASQTREVYQELGEAHEMYLNGIGTPRAFTMVIRVTLAHLREIEQRLSSHP